MREKSYMQNEALSVQDTMCLRVNVQCCYCLRTDMASRSFVYVFIMANLNLTTTTKSAQVRQSASNLIGGGKGAGGVGGRK